MTAPHLIDALHDLDAPPALAAVEVEAPARRQPGQRVELYVEGEEPYVVHITNRERIAYEKVAARHREWPPMETGQHFAMTFVCWAAAKRAEHTALTFDQFQEVLLDWEVVAQVPADPTQ
jgi:hypothetical protein